MPRVAINKSKYLAADLYAYIIGQMKSQGITQERLGEELGLTQQVVSRKLRKKQLNTEELITAVNVLAIDGRALALMFGRE